MRNVKSILLTFVCAVIILGVGYLGIVGQGKRILKSESLPEKAEYENAGSNIFYGKIEDDIEIFPWNYYPENVVKEELIPQFVMDNAFTTWYLQNREYDVDEVITNADGEISDLQAEYYVAADAYFSGLIAYVAGDEEEIFRTFQRQGGHILQNMTLIDNSPVGTIYFYQDVLKRGSKKYQVRIACSDWNVINFSCTEYSEEDKREQERWKSGKERMVKILEESEDSLSKYYSYMSQLNDLGSPVIYYDLNGEYENAYLNGLRYLENIMMGVEWDEELLQKMEVISEQWDEMFQSENKVDYEDVINEREEVEYSVDYSYQVVELKDVILLLVQGDVTMGFYFDPISQKFCGYNFFYEY